MPDERDIQRAKRAELEAIVEKFGTETECWQLTVSGVLQAGVTLSQLVTNEGRGGSRPTPWPCTRLHAGLAGLGSGRTPVDALSPRARAGRHDGVRWPGFREGLASGRD